MIVVDYMKLKKAKAEFAAAFVKYEISKSRYGRSSDKIKTVYPDCLSYEDVPNQSVVKEHRRLMKELERARNNAYGKLYDYYDMKTAFMAGLID